MIETSLLLGSFLVLILLGVPIAFSLGIAALLTAEYTGLGTAMIVQRVGSGMQSFPLLAIPLFILAGAIMAKGGVARRIVDFAYIIVGPFPGGLAMVNCVRFDVLRRRFRLRRGGHLLDRPHHDPHDGPERVRPRVCDRPHRRLLHPGDHHPPEPQHGHLRHGRRRGLHREAVSGRVYPRDPDGGAPGDHLLHPGAQTGVSPGEAAAASGFADYSRGMGSSASSRR